MSKELKISLIGAGNVAWHLGSALAAKADVCEVVSRHPDTSQALARQINAVMEQRDAAGRCKPMCDLGNLSDDSDFYIIAANDDAIKLIINSTPDYPGIWAHTSGSVDIDVFAGHKSRYGSLYPLQTFSRQNDVNVAEVPFFIEGSDPSAAAALTTLASLISENVNQATSERRRALHIAAVFACNFATQMWDDADMLLHQQGLDISCFLPLLKATLGKLPALSPREAMTGPARRGDIDVLKCHINQLPPDMKEVYRIISSRILANFHPDKVGMISSGGKCKP